MAHKRRNHFIPRVLLNRFASRTQGSKYWVWQVGRDCEAHEISTKDAGVSTYFYGYPETGVEDAFVPLEAEFGEFLRNLDRGADPNESTDFLRRFVWILASSENSAIRQQAAKTGRELLSRVAAVIALAEH